MFVDSLHSDVTWFSSSQQDSPQMMGHSNGDMLKVLDACLVTGFGEKLVQSVSLDGNNVILSFGVGHGYLVNQRILVSGADDTLLNGNHRIANSTNNTVSIIVIGVTSGSGSITAKASPLGFESVFGTANPLKRAYRSLSPTSAKKLLYLNMEHPASSGYHPTSPVKRASVSVCRDMQVLGEQIGSMTSAINGSTTNGALHWYQKRGRSNSEAVLNSSSKWTVVGNSKFFYFIVGWSSDPRINELPMCDVYAFGEYAGLYDDPSDKTFLMANYNVGDTGNQDIGELGGLISSATPYTAASAYIVVDGQLTNKSLSIVSGADSLSFKSGFGSIRYPNSNGNALFTMPIRIAKSSSEQIYGMMPSINFVENKMDGNTYNGTVVDDLLLVSVAQFKTFNEAYSYYAFYVGG